jgi:hypothetical protein
MTVEAKIIHAFLITLLCESIIICFILRNKNWLKTLSGVFLINCFTHPIAIYLIHFKNWSTITVEVLIILMEAIFYLKLFKINLKKSVSLSLIANVFSIITGLIFRSINF